MMLSSFEARKSSHLRMSSFPVDRGAAQAGHLIASPEP